MDSFDDLTIREIQKNPDVLKNTITRNLVYALATRHLCGKDDEFKGLLDLLNLTDEEKKKLNEKIILGEIARDEVKRYHHGKTEFDKCEAEWLGPEISLKYYPFVTYYEQEWPEL